MKKRVYCVPGSNKLAFVAAAHNEKNKKKKEAIDLESRRIY